MKNKAFVTLVVGIIIVFVLGMVIYIDDAIHHRGYNFMTTAEYRDMVSEGKK